MTSVLLVSLFIVTVASQLYYYDPRELSVLKAIQDFTLTRNSSDGRLIVTNFLKTGEIEKARELSRVRGEPFFDDVVSYSGYFTVDERYGSNMFFWFFPAENNYEEAPVLLWLQGGPGSSSMFGLFTEIGPYILSKNGTLDKMPLYWSKQYSVLFIDNPVGTGFSYTEDLSGFSTNQTHVGLNLYEATVQFFTLFPNLQSNEFYLTGESYAGKYIPALAYTIHKMKSSGFKINLKGLIMGNGASDPVSEFNYSELVYQLGFVDTAAKQEMRLHEDLGRKYIRAGDIENAFKEWYYSIRIFEERSDFSNLYNFLFPKEPEVGGNFQKFLNKKKVRKALHVGRERYYDMSSDVYYYMLGDIMLSVKEWVETLLDNGYRVVYYNGQMDIIVAYVLYEDYFRSLRFESSEEYKTAARKLWYVDGELAGYIKTAGNFTEVLVRNAGHMVPSDQPKWALDLLDKIIRNDL